MGGWLYYIIIAAVAYFVFFGGLLTPTTPA